MCAEEKSDPQEGETILPGGKERAGQAERRQEATESSEVEWVHVFSRPGIFETTQLPLPNIHFFKRTADWLNLILILYRIVLN